jgi:hypothetical protein
MKIKGIHYSNPFVYNLLTFLKLWRGYNARFRIAAGYVAQNSSVLDVCSASGELKGYLQENCAYECIEMSPVFTKLLDKKKIKCHRADMHRGIDGSSLRFDCLVMIISLCQFRETSINALLEDFKKIAKKVVIIEDVTEKIRPKGSIVQKIMNYLCATDYFVPMRLFTAAEFRSTMQEHGYTVIKHTNRYFAGCYERN